MILFTDQPGLTDSITYRTKFDLSAFSAPGWRIDGRWAADDSGLTIRLNGALVPGLVHPGRDGYLWTLERKPDGISFISGKPYVKQNVFTKLDPVTGRPEYDMTHKPEVGKRAKYCPSLWGGKDWVPAAYSPKTGYLYIPANENLCQELEGEEVEYRPGQQYTGAQTRDFIVAEGADHIGELQAWNMKTGERVWYYQTTPNDAFDFDATAEWMIADLRVDGQMRKTLINAHKGGFLYVLDRTNGKFIKAEQYVNDVNWTKGINPKTGMPVEYDPKLDVQIYNREARALRGDGQKRSCPTWHGGVAHQPLLLLELVVEEERILPAKGGVGLRHRPLLLAPPEGYRAGC